MPAPTLLPTAIWRYRTFFPQRRPLRVRPYAQSTAGRVVWEQGEGKQYICVQGMTTALFWHVEDALTYVQGFDRSAVTPSRKTRRSGETL